ncbi:MAG: peptidylprolyl isomerase [Burkholderiales bacterium]|nr:peptidylprolyl isomerase [Burkholderiales bacterium]
MLIKSRVVLGSAIALLALSACTSKDASKTAAASQGAVAATVNGSAIYQKQVDMIIKQQAAQGMPDNAESRKMVIDNLAMQTIVAQEAAKKGLDKSPEIADQLEMTRLSILANAFVQDYLKTNSVSDAMLTAEYDKFKTQAAGTEYQARHILLAKEDEAKDIIAKLKKDVKAFDALAKAKSQDPGSKGKGGDLGWFDPRGMVPEFGAAVAKLEKGHFSEEPVKTQYGYHVIMLEDSRAKEAPTLEQVKPGLTQQLQQQNLKKMLDEMKAKAKIEMVAAASASASASAAASLPAAASAAASADASAK